MQTVTPKWTQRQRQAIRAVRNPDVREVVISAPRGWGKSTFAAHVCRWLLDPDDRLYVPGSESVIVSGSITQCRIVFRILRGLLEPDGPGTNPDFQFCDSANRLYVERRQCGTRLRGHGSNGRTLMGLVGCPMVICDEPGSWELAGGSLVHDAIRTAASKSGSPLKSVYVGTLAPGAGDPSHWFHRLVTNSSPSRYNDLIQGSPSRWDDFRHLRSLNPAIFGDPVAKKTFIEEVANVRKDARLKPAFMSYRMNIVTKAESDLLLSPVELAQLLARPAPEREGLPFLGMDLGGPRAWCAVTSVWPNGRLECFAMCGGEPGLAERERMDSVPSGTYTALAELDALITCPGKRVPPVAELLAVAEERWGPARAISCDRFRLPELEDARPGCPIQPRTMVGWSRPAEDVASLRKLSLDGPLAVDPSSVGIFKESIAACGVENGPGGVTRLRKRDTNNTGRDDVAAAATLACGSLERHLRAPPSRSRSLFLEAV